MDMSCASGRSRGRTFLSIHRVHPSGARFGTSVGVRLRAVIGRQMWEATEQWNRTGKPARVFAEFGYQTRRTKNAAQDRQRRVVAKAEHKMARWVLVGEAGDPSAIPVGRKHELERIEREPCRARARVGDAELPGR